MVKIKTSENTILPQEEPKEFYLEAALGGCTGIDIFSQIEEFWENKNNHVAVIATFLSTGCATYTPI